MNKTSLLARAILVGREDVVRRLVTLGASVTDSHGELLGKAVLNADVAMVWTLLELGVSPLAGEDLSALEMTVVPEDHHWIEPNDRHLGPPPELGQRREMLALLLAALRERKLAMPENSRLADWALRLAGTPDGAPLARMVLEAGIPADQLPFDRVHDALASPDRTLFGKLLANGLMENAGAGERSEYAGALVREAALADRADVLPALLALQPDLGQRGKDGLAALDIAIRRGNTALVEGLLAAGVRLNTAGGDGSTALDHAIVSGNAAMLRLIAAKTGRDIRSTCVPDSAALAGMVHAAGDAYWRTLREAGFGARRCAGMTPRLIAQFAGDSPTWYAGWVAERVRQRMADLYADDPRAAGDAATAALLRQPRNSALAQVLQRAGWPTAAFAQPNTRTLGKRRIVADQVLRKTLPGDYEMSDGGPPSVLQLRIDGTFTLVQGGTGEKIDGVWTVENGRLRVANTPAPAGTLPFKPVASPAGEAPAGALAVDVYYRGKKVPGMEISAFGDKPWYVSGTSQRDGWLGKWQGPVRQVALAHKSIEGGRPYVFEVPAAQATQTRFAFAVSDKLPNRIFDEPVDIDGDTLVWQRGQDQLPYRRKAAGKEVR